MTSVKWRSDGFFDHGESTAETCSLHDVIMVGFLVRLHERR